MRTKEEYVEIAKRADEVTEAVLHEMTHGKYGVKVYDVYPHVFRSVFQDMLRDDS